MILIIFSSSHPVKCKQIFTFSMIIDQKLRYITHYLQAEYFQSALDFVLYCCTVARFFVWQATQAHKILQLVANFTFSGLLPH